MYNLVQNWYEGNTELQPFNQPLLTLIPKSKNPPPPTDSRLISHCNITYKILSKILSNRLKGILPGYLEPNQGAFTQGRGSLDNTLVVLEIIHSILTKDRRLNNGAPCIVIKLDILSLR